MKSALNAAINSILGIICQLVWLETKEYGGVSSVAYVPLQLGVFNRIGCGTVVVAHWYMTRSCLILVINWSMTHFIHKGFFCSFPLGWPCRQKAYFGYSMLIL